MDIPAEDGFVLQCDGHEYAAHVRNQDAGGNPGAASRGNWWVLIGNEERRSPVPWDPEESRGSVSAKLCEWVRGGAGHTTGP